MKRVGAFLLLLLSVLSFFGCVPKYESAHLDDYTIGYCEDVNRAFVGRYVWDGRDETKKIDFPDTYKKIPITCMGGEVGTYPYTMRIEFSDETKKALSPETVKWGFIDRGWAKELVGAEPEYILFDVHIGKNLSEIYSMQLGGIIAAEHTDGKETRYDFYILLCNVTCDEENETFYSKNGKLYYRDGDALVEDICYSDFDINEYIRENGETVGAFIVF